MGLITLNEKPVLAMRLQQPRMGVWVCLLEVDSEDDITGAVKLEDDGVTYNGTVIEGGVTAGRWQGRVVGGKAGLRGTLRARNYQRIKVREILDGILLDAGEALSGNATTSVLRKSLAFWSRRQGSGIEAMNLLAENIGAGWRVFPDGSVWIGDESWPAFRGSDLNQLDRINHAGRLELAPNDIGLAPGSAVEGLNIEHVEHTIESQGLRTAAWYEAA